MKIKLELEEDCEHYTDTGDDHCINGKLYNSGKPCPECGGLGTILTQHGLELLLFLRRNAGRVLP